MDELPLLLWEKLPVCSVLVSLGMFLEEWPWRQQSVGMGRKGPLALWGVIYPTHKGEGDRKSVV